MANALDWVSATFNSEANKDDLIKARSLNITRITGVVVPVLAGVAAAIGEVAEKPPFNDTAFQQQLVLALIALVAVVTTADIVGRAVSSNRCPPPVVGTAGAFVAGIAAQHRKDGTDPDGKIVAMRTVDGKVQYMFVDESTSSISWVTDTEITLRNPPS